MSRNSHDALCGVCGIVFQSLGHLVCVACRLSGADAIPVVCERGISWERVPTFVMDGKLHGQYRAYLVSEGKEPSNAEDLLAAGLVMD